MLKKKVIWGTRKEWYLHFEGLEEGPFSIIDLRGNNRLTPDTLVRREGETQWKYARNIPDFDPLFQDANTEEEETIDANSKWSQPKSSDQLTMALRWDPSYFLWMLLFLIAIILYTFYLFQHS